MLVKKCEGIYRYNNYRYICRWKHDDVPIVSESDAYMNVIHV